MYVRITHLLLFLILVPVAVLWFTGCDGEDAFSGPECPPADAATTITSFVIGGNFAPQNNLPVVKKGTQTFEIDWDVSTSCKYTFSVNLSQDEKFDEDEDIEIFSGNCALNLNCREFADFDCEFSENNPGELYINCDNSSDVDVTAVLDETSPVQQNAFLFLEVTNEAGNISVQTRSEAIFDY